MTTPFELTVTKTVPAPQRDVFEAWLDPEALAHFMRPGEGMTVPKVEVDAREGGRFLIVMKAGEQEIPHRGEYQTIEPHRRLVFTWVSGMTMEGSRVTLDFEPISERETKLTLHHVGFPSEEARNNHEGGWGAIVDALSRHLG